MLNKLQVLSLSVLAAFAAQGAVIDIDGPPNIVLIFMDDLGYNDIGAFTCPDPPNQYPVSGPAPKPGGSDVDLPDPNEAYGLTPRIDSLAEGGMKMTQFYASSRCSSARASLMTGRYDARTGVNAVFYPNHSTGLSTTEVTIPELLRQSGYATAMIGKWHLGYNPNRHNPYQMMPVRHGFHEFLGYPHSNDMNSLNLIRNETIEEADFSSAAEQAQITWRYTEAALDFIQRASGADKPFYLYLAHTMTHRPTWPSDREYTNADGTIWPKFQGISGVSYYYDVVKEVDHSTGRILDKLEELGIDDNTLVIFTSDNGPWTRLSGVNLTSYAVGSAYPLRDGKGTTWEGGCRVPFVAQWPNAIPSGTESGEITGLVDLLPTFVKLAGGELPTDRTIDGIDLSGLWTGESGWSFSRSAYALFNNGAVSAVLKDDYKLRSGALYNLVNDIQETTDVSGSQAAVLADLEAESATIAASITAENNSLGSFTSYEVLLSANDLSVPEGGTATVEISLSADPGQTVVVMVTRFAGDTDLTVAAGETLTFTSSDWNSAQTVTLAAAQDPDEDHSGATFRVTTDDIEQVRKLFAFEADDEAAPDVLANLIWPKGDVMAVSNTTVKLVAEGSVLLGGTNNPAGTVMEWTKISGPGDVVFTDATTHETGVSFSSTGLYWIRFSADHPAAGSFGSADFKVQVGVEPEVTVETSYSYSPVLVYDASEDSDGDAVWENMLSPGNRDWALDSSIVRTPIDPAAQLSFIDAAYVFAGGSMPDGATSQHFDEYSTGDASFEFWFKPDSLPLASPQVLWESGGAIGAGFVIEGSTLRFGVDDSTGAVAEGTLAPSAAQDGFVHCIGVIDLANDEIRLYLDGVLVDTESIPGVSDWCGTSQTGLGTIAHSNGSETSNKTHLGGYELLTETYGRFAGQIAWVSFYDRVLTGAEVLSLTSGPAVTSTTNTVPTYVGNVAPLTSAGIDQTLPYPIGVQLDGAVQDDGQPGASMLTTFWHLISGAGSASFNDATELDTTVSCNLPGTYQLRLEAEDGEIKVYDDVELIVDALTYADWVSLEELPTGQDRVGDNPDGDRFNNYWEWVLGQDPEAFDPPILSGMVTAPGGTNFVNFTFTFEVPRNRVPSLGLETSENLGNWTVVSNLAPWIEVLDIDSARWTYELAVDAEELPTLFVRPVGAL
ncbi:sulfatase-like hydrolase/transferase [Pontiellaceae bacterium B12227]|nr:sulfatase-like hydrolase/transferase [Pontiellaceae bacterium B12227]